MRLLFAFLIVASTASLVAASAAADEQQQCIGEQCVNVDAVADAVADAAYDAAAKVKDAASDAAKTAADVAEHAAAKVSGTTEERTKEEANSNKCPSREHVVKCAGMYLDKNNNGLLERQELQAAIDALPWYSRGIISILGSVDKVSSLKCFMV